MSYTSNENTKTLPELEALILKAPHPNAYHLFHEYLQLSDDVCATFQANEQVLVYKRCYDTLLETMCDSLLPLPWRIYALNNMYRPLLRLDSLADNTTLKDEITFFNKQAATLSRYFLR